MTDHTKLRELALAAECGEWVFDGEEVIAPEHELSIDVLPVLICDPCSGMGPYIAAANPAAVLGLLDEITALRAENEALQQRIAVMQEPMTQDDIADLWSEQLFHVTDVILAEDFVRDVERFHGIGIDAAIAAKGE